MFAAFLHALGGYSRGDKIESRYPPEPDILYTAESASPLAFELVAIEDTDARRKRSITEEVVFDATEAHARLPTDIRTAFDKIFCNAWISFYDLEGMSRVRRRKFVAAMLPILIERPRLRHGSPHYDDIIELSAYGSSRVYVSRGGPYGPRFQPAAWMHKFGTPLSDAIHSKLAKTYESTYPIALLAYSGITPLGRIGDAVWRQNFLTEFGSAFGPELKFVRLYIYDHGERKVVLCHPPLAGQLYTNEIS